jgi:hypothetical protein
MDFAVPRACRGRTGHRPGLGRWATQPAGTVRGCQTTSRVDGRNDGPDRHHLVNIVVMVVRR